MRRCPLSLSFSCCFPFVCRTVAWTRWTVAQCRSRLNASRDGFNLLTLEKVSQNKTKKKEKKFTIDLRHAAVRRFQTFSRNASIYVPTHVSATSNHLRPTYRSGIIYDKPLTAGCGRHKAWNEMKSLTVNSETDRLFQAIDASMRPYHTDFHTDRRRPRRTSTRTGRS